MTVKLKIASILSKAGGKLAKSLGKGSGEQITGVIFNRLIPNPISSLTKDKEIVLISATNGKTSTTNMIVECAKLQNASIASNLTGANLLAGITSALIHAPKAKLGIFETDERVVSAMLKNSKIKVLVLGNLSRDQLDRYGEVTGISTDWKKGLALSKDTVVVANSLDPNVVSAAIDSPNVIWVQPPQTWTEDAPSCPSCFEKITFKPDSFSCSKCDFASPEPQITVGKKTIEIDGIKHDVKMALKGQWNLVNAALALGVCKALGYNIENCIRTIEEIDNIQGRGTVVEIGKNTYELCLAKNPAGYTELIKYYKETKPETIIFAFNTRVADGKDPSWLWDVPFEELPNAKIITCGERASDISNRLQYAQHEVQQVSTLKEALILGDQTTSVVASYTQFYKNSTKWAEVIHEAIKSKPVTPIYSNKISLPKQLKTKLTIGLIFPDVLGTYGDRGNAVALKHRAQQLGIDAEIVEIQTNDPIPESIDIYCFGGGEDAAQTLASNSILKNKKILARRSDVGAVIITVCAGFQLFGKSYIDANGKENAGLEIFDVETVAGTKRNINEIVVETTFNQSLSSPLTISGFENHGGISILGGDSKAFGKVLYGFGNNGITDGAIIRNTFGTYAHGPLLPRNPIFCDHLINLVTGLDMKLQNEKYNFSHMVHDERILESRFSDNDRKTLLKKQNTTY
jgi:CobQ-like glutamine amidotransferase family enzyme/UDP-N-acetylmuramyl tripeptide synthase